jgi:hypothetical protein
MNESKVRWEESMGDLLQRWYICPRHELAIWIYAWISVPKIKYKPGKLNVVADALSCRPDHLLNAISLIKPTEELLQR